MISDHLRQIRHDRKFILDQRLLQYLAFICIISYSFSAIFSSGTLYAADSVTITDTNVKTDAQVIWQAGSKTKFNTYGNCQAEISQLDGFDCIKVTLGGVTTDKSGAIQFVIDLPSARSNINHDSDVIHDSVTLTYRGDGSSGQFVMLVRDQQGNDYCWNGLRHLPEAMIPCYDENWRKRVFSLEQFISSSLASKQVDSSPQLIASGIVNLQLAVGMQLHDPSKKLAEFYLMKIALENNAVEEIVAASRSFAAPTSESTTMTGSTTTAMTTATSESRATIAPLTLDDYQLPEWVDWNIEQHYRRETARRILISLNNYWQFQPVFAATVTNCLEQNGELPEFPRQPPQVRTDPWWYMKAPGRWDGNGFYLLDRNKNRIEEINKQILGDYVQAFYRRNVFIPADWQNKQVLLHINAVSEQARLYVNQVPVVDFFRTGQFDISKWLIPGKDNQLALCIQVASLPLKKTDSRNSEFSQSHMGTKWWYNWHDGPGIADDIFLQILPKNYAGNDLQIITSVTEKNLTAGAEYTNYTDQEQSLLLTAEVWSDDNIVHTLPESAVVLPARATRRLTITTATWPELEYWSPENPRLYSLRYQLRDAKRQLLDEIHEEFGFREIGFSDGDFYLNGVKIRLKFNSSQYKFASLTEPVLDELLLSLKNMNFNGIMLEAMNQQVVDKCNRLGLMVVLRHVMPPLVRGGTYLPGVPNKGYPFEVYFSSKYQTARNKLETAIAAIVCQFRNDPALIMWAINPLLCWNSEWINPNLLDARQPVNDLQRATKMQEDFIRKIDPSRLVLWSMSSSSGAIITANPYPTFSNNPDEWADWPMKWAEKREKPLILEEIALPFNVTFANWYNNVTDKPTEWHERRQLYTEQAARYFGDAIYSQARDLSVDTYWWNLSASKMTKNGIRLNELAYAAEESAILWRRRCMTAWRAYDISGIWPFESPMLYYSTAVNNDLVQMPQVDVTLPGRKDDYVKPGDYLCFDYPNKIQQVNTLMQQPFLAFIAGRKERFTSREHIYYSGETVEKQLIISNDCLRKRSYSVNWQIIRSSDQAQVASDKLEGEIPAGAVRFLPLLWQTEPVRQRESYQLKVVVTSETDRIDDNFTLHIYPNNVKKFNHNNLPLELYDESGKTRNLFDLLQLEYSENPTDSAKLLVVGVNSFTSGFLQRYQPGELEKRLKNGLTLLILAQNTDSLLSQYLEERRVRQVFVKDQNHSILAKIPAVDLHYWRGEPDSVIAYPDLGMSVRKQRFMRWGTEGAVATFVMDKPASGRFRTLLDCDADLSRTALLEYFVGDGRVIFCQLDLVARYGKDPAATLLAEQLLNYSLNPQPALVTTVAVTNGATDSVSKLVQQLGFACQQVDNLPVEARLVIIGADFTIEPEKLQEFVAQGGKVLVLGVDASLLKQLALPVTVEINKKKMRLADYQRENQLLRGLGNSDFYYNPAQEISIFSIDNNQNDTGDHKQELVFLPVTHGQGEYLLCSLRPEYFAETASSNKVKRLISTLLTNLQVRGNDAINLQSTVSDIILDETNAAFITDPGVSGEKNGYHLTDYDDSAWQTIVIGSHWEGQGITMDNPHFTSSAALPYDGEAWYRIKVEIPTDWQGRDLYFIADAIDDCDWTYLNGKLIGQVDESTPNYWQVQRCYPLPRELIRFGESNVIAVRVRDLRGNGGIIGKVRVGGREAVQQPLFFPQPSRLIQNFDPNAWRQL